MNPEKLRRSISNEFGVTISQTSDSAGSLARAKLYGQTLCAVEIESMPVEGRFRFLVKHSTHDGFGGVDIKKGSIDFAGHSPDETLNTWVVYSTLMKLRDLVRKALSN